MSLRVGWFIRYGLAASLLVTGASWTGASMADSPPPASGSADTDNDGWSLNAGDCDDSNPNVYPGASELCDGVDTNCNGEIDDEDAEGCSPYYRDADDDGFGVGGMRCLCGPADPVDAQQTGDCNDSNQLKYPGASEKCNNEDDNCNGMIDEGKDGEWPGCDDPIWDLCTWNGGTWAECGSGCGPFTCDNPGAADGGCPEVCVPQCTCPGTHVWDATLGCIALEKCDNIPMVDNDGDGWSSDGGDCDDTQPTTFPGAEEACDGADNNCDGVVDDGCVEPDEVLCDDTGGQWAACGSVCGPFTCDNPAPAACAGKACGDDGCGGVCGQCPDDAPYCVDGACLETCAPACDGKECGDDGCGGTCGTCAEASPVCGDDGLCGAGIPCSDFGPDLSECEDFNPCSWDTCDLKTGACAFTPITPEDCDDGHFCTVDSCSIPWGGCQHTTNICDDDDPCTFDSCEAEGCKYVAVDGPCTDNCEPVCVGKACGDNGCGGSCGMCAAGTSCSTTGECVDCTPNCEGKECGDDDCGGTCGGCPAGLTCGASGTCDCAPQCACPGTQVWDDDLGCIPVESCGAPLDNDGDGWSPDDGDCDDSNPDAYPGASESCDGLDNNCDGEIDEGCDEPDTSEALCEGTGGSWEQAPDCAEGDDCPSLCVCPSDSSCWATDKGCHPCPEAPAPSEEQALCEQSDGEWTDCVSGCGPYTCDAPPPGPEDDPPICGAVCTEGCECPASHVWDPESGCIPLGDCPPSEEEPQDAPADAGGGGGGCAAANNSGPLPFLLACLLLLGINARRRTMVRTSSTR